MCQDQRNGLCPACDLYRCVPVYTTCTTTPKFTYELTSRGCKDDLSCLIIVESEVGERENLLTIDETWGHNLLRGVYPLYLYGINISMCLEQ